MARATEEEAASREVSADAIADVMPGFVELLVDMANENQSDMDGTTGPVKEIISNNELVFAVWQEPSHRHGVGLLLLKGDDIIREAMASGGSVPCKVSAVQVPDYEAAIAADMILGVHEKPN